MAKKKQGGGRDPAAPKAEEAPRARRSEGGESGADEAPRQPRNREEGIRRLHEATDEINGVW
jgi:hypothetical protein